MKALIKPKEYCAPSVFENTLESYHVNLIHEETFRKLGVQDMDFQFIKNHSTWGADLLLKEDDEKVKRIHKPYHNRSYKIDGYKHMILFPNVLISSTYSISYNLSTFQPVNENESIFTSYVFMTKTDGEIVEKKAVQNMYEKSIIEFNRKVFNEDKEIREQVQIGVNHSHYTGELSDEEERVCEFQKAYRSYFK